MKSNDDLQDVESSNAVENTRVDRSPSKSSSFLFTLIFGAILLIIGMTYINLVNEGAKTSALNVRLIIIY